MHRKTCKQVGRRQPVIVTSSLQIAGPRPNNSVVRLVRGLCVPLVHTLLSEVSRHSPPSITDCFIEPLCNRVLNPIHFSNAFLGNRICGVYEYIFAKWEFLKHDDGPLNNLQTRKYFNISNKTHRHTRLKPRQLSCTTFILLMHPNYHNFFSPIKSLDSSILYIIHLSRLT